MQKPAKLIYKLFSYLFVSAILFFLAYNLSTNWQKVKDYQFSFNYFYLILSCFILCLSIVGIAIVWNRILRIIDKDHKLSYFRAIKIYIYAEFAKYVPGNVWTIFGKMYLLRKSGISQGDLFISSFLDGVLHTIATFILGVFFLAISLGYVSPVLYVISIFTIIGGMIFVHPKIFYRLFNFFLVKIGKTPINSVKFLSYRNIIKITSCYLVVALLSSAAFFFFMKSFTGISSQSFAGLAGIYSISMAIGIAALFAPSGLGVREGVLVMLSSYYFPISIAVIFSFLTRIWMTIIEIILFIIVYLSFKFNDNYYLALFFNKLFFSKKIPVLLYHQINDKNSRLSIDPKRFEEQMSFLKNAGYHSVTPSDLYDFLFNNKKIPSKSVLISFDDGFRDNFETARNLLKQYDFKAVFFIVSGYIGGQSDYCRDPKDKEEKIMSQEEIKGLHEDGFCIANHFYSHKNLINLTAEEIKFEYDKGREILKQIIGQEKCLDFVAYPRNKKNKEVIEALKSLGVKLAFGGDRGLISAKSDLLDLPRVEIFNSDSILRFSFKLSPIGHFLNKLINLLRLNLAKRRLK